MKCNCGGKGWTESWHAGAASWTPTLQQCRARCNLTGYSNEVMARLNNPKHVTERPVVMATAAERPAAPVLPFRRKE